MLRIDLFTRLSRQVRYIQQNDRAGSGSHTSWLNHVSEVESREPVRIAFFGFYGRKNYGDDLFGYLLQSVCEAISHITPMIVAATGSYEITAAWYPRVCGKWLFASGPLGTVARFSTYLAAIARADVIVFGGGSLFGSHASLPFVRVLTQIARALRKPVHAVGVGVGPFETTLRANGFLRVVKQLDSIAARDEASARLAASVRTSAPNMGDLAYMLPSLYQPKRATDGQRTLVIALHRQEYIDATLAILVSLVEQDLIDALSIVSLDPQSKSVCDTLAARVESMNLQARRIAYGASILEIVDVIASAVLVVTSKLHGAITSYVYDVPTLLYCYERKCVEFLDDAGLAGPRDMLPSASECVDAATALLRGGSPVANFAQTHRSAWLDAFRDRVAQIGKGTSKC